ncbi:hypothetical protein [Streptomyces sp. NPDC051364]|uniref:hypothetical protein n=1 Tax=Streptomyces sp. NPDC051364 TaxID=3155799 RepID=UPI00343A219B
MLVREKHAGQAVTLIRHTASQLTVSYDRRSPHHLAVLGLLLLRGATAASRADDRAATGEFLAEAEEVARYVALDQPDAWANFSPTNVTLHRISAAVSFGDAGIVKALKLLGERVHPDTGRLMSYTACEVIGGHAHIADTDELAELAWVAHIEISQYIPYPLFAPVQEHLDVVLER